jgi:hypothetical protein
MFRPDSLCPSRQKTSQDSLNHAFMFADKSTAYSDNSRIVTALVVARGPVIQRKLEVGAVNDPLEHEADSVADKVMRMPDQPFVQRKCATCKEEDNALQRKELTGNGSGAATSEVPPIVHEVLRSTGQSLDRTTQTFMESRFREDFGNVRIHNDAKAVESARAMNAKAYTVGRDVVFGSGHYAPHGRDGRKLIAHELAHVAQNRYSNLSLPTLEPTSGRAEAEAYRAGHLAGIGLPAGQMSARHAGIALTPTSDSVIPLISYSAVDWEVTADEEREVLRQLRAVPDLSQTIVDIHAAGMLTYLLERVDEPENRRDLLRLLGARLNSSARALVEPIIQDLDLNRGHVYGAQIQYNLGRAHIRGGATRFDSTAYSDLVSSDAMAAFTGAGATGVNPSERGYSDLMRAGTSMLDDHINPVGSLSAYLAGLTPDQRRRQAELLINQPISTNYAESYAGEIPSRLQVMRAAGNTHNIEGALVAAIILAEQRDQSRVEDARDFIGALVFSRNTSIGLGQVVPSTARRHDLFSDLLTNRSTTYSATTSRSNVNQAQMAWLLSSDETNIFAVARYIRILANDGATRSIASLPNTQAEFPGIDLAAYANNSSMWPEDNVGALGMYYTSRAWTDNVMSSGWGWFVQQAYRDIKSAALF